MSRHECFRDEAVARTDALESVALDDAQARRPRPGRRLLALHIATVWSPAGVSAPSRPEQPPALSVADDGDTGPSRLARQPGNQMRRSTTRRIARRRRRTRQCRSRTLRRVARDSVCAISVLPVLRDDAIEEHVRTPGGIEDTTCRPCFCRPRPCGPCRLSKSRLTSGRIDQLLSIGRSCRSRVRRGLQASARVERRIEPGGVY
jgi:hypothetical protein